MKSRRIRFLEKTSAEQLRIELIARSQESEGLLSLLKERNGGSIESMLKYKQISQELRQDVKYWRELAQTLQLTRQRNQQELSRLKKGLGSKHPPN